MATGVASTTLALRHIFGINVGVSDNLSFTDEDNICYVAGNNLSSTLKKH